MQLAPLDPEYFKADERTLDQYLAFMAKVGQAFTFFNLKNQPEGNWGQFLLAEPLFLTAVIKNTETASTHNQALDFMAAIQSHDSTGMLPLFYQYYFDIALGVALGINRWYQHSQKLLVGNSFGQHLSQTIERQAGPAWQQVYNQYYSLTQSCADFKNKMLLKTQALAPIWQFTPFPPATPVPMATTTLPECQPTQAWNRQLASKVQQLFHVQDLIIGAAGQYYQQALQRQDLPPQTGMLLAFLHTLENQQALLNKSTQKHLDFYYRQVLGMQPTPAQAAQTFISLNLNPNTPTFTLPKNTPFVAGLQPNNSTNRVFGTQQPLLINQAQLSRFETLCLAPVPKPQEVAPPEAGPQPTPNNLGGNAAAWWSPPTQESPPAAASLPLLKGIYTAINSTFNQLPVQHVPAFGQPLAVPNTTLGWAFAAPNFLLTSGQRQLRLTMQLKATGPAAQNALEILKMAHHQTPGAVPKALFSAQITGAEDWLDLPYGTFDTGPQQSPVQRNHNTPAGQYQFNLPESTLIVSHDQVHLVLCYVLNEAQPATAPYNAEVHGTGYSTPHPVLRIQLTNAPTQGSQLPYGQQLYHQLATLQIQQLEVSAYVQNFQGFSAQNNDGPVDLTQPFTPLGASAIQNSTLFLGAQELFCKPVQHLTLTFSWLNLPLTQSFFDYYKQYNRFPLTEVSSDEIPAGSSDEIAAGSSDEIAGASPAGSSGEIPAGSSGESPPSPKSILVAPYYLTPTFQVVPAALGKGRWYHLHLTQKPELASNITPTYFSLYNELTQASPFAYNMGQAPNLAGARLEEQKYLPATSKRTLALNLNNPALVNPNMGPVEAYTPNSTQGYLRLVLANPLQGFGQEDFPRVSSQVTNQNLTRVVKAATSAMGGHPTSPPEKLQLLDPPRTPYIPTAQSLTTNYRASQTWQFNNPASPAETAANTTAPNNISMYWQDVWQSVPVALSSTQPPSLLPHYTASGYAYLGFEQATPGTAITLLLTVQTPVQCLTQKQVPTLHIEYPTPQGWQILTPQKDGTRGLLQTGIVHLVVPQNIDLNSPLVPPPAAEQAPATTWLRLAQTANLQVKVGFVATNAVPVMDTTPGLPTLPAQTIVRPVQNIAALNAVVQPLKAVQLYPPQSPDEFWQNTAWRLQNKQRANRLADYETLALQQFGQLYKANATTLAPQNQVQLVVVPQTNLQTNALPFRPNCPASLLLQILDYLSPRQNMGTTLEVCNALPYPLHVSGQLVLEPAYASPQTLDQIKAALRLFLSPWVQNNPYATQIPPQYTKGTIYAFIKNQPHVLKVKNLALNTAASQQEQAQAQAQANTANHTVAPNTITPPSNRYLLVPGSMDQLTQQSHE